MEMSVSCPGCYSLSVERFLLAPDYTTGERFQLWKCCHCQLVHTPLPSDLGRYYKPEYRGYGRLVSRLLEVFYDWRVSTWTALYPEPGLALEVGCGPGFMLAALRRRGWRAVGFERSAGILRHARATEKLDVFAGDWHAIRSGPRFDLIVLFQVLEHLPDPRTTLLECAKLLKPSGRIIIGVPNLGSWQARLFGSGWFHLDVPRHLFHFTPQSLEEVLRGAGCESFGVRFVSWEHDPYGWVQSALNRLGFEHNLLTRLLMRMRPRHSGPFAISATIVLAALLAPAAAIAALFSWSCGQGAVMEIQAKHRC